MSQESADSTEPSKRTLEELVDRHYWLVYRFAYRLCGTVVDAEDLAQQTFLIAQEKLDQLREWGQAGSWLCAIARNVYLKQIRRPVPTNSLDQSEPVEEIALDRNLVAQELQAVLDELPEDHKSPLILFYFREFTYKEIARQLGVPIGTVMSRLSRARVWLRERLNRSGQPQDDGQDSEERIPGTSL